MTIFRNIHWDIISPGAATEKFQFYHSSDKAVGVWKSKIGSVWLDQHITYRAMAPSTGISNVQPNFETKKPLKETENKDVLLYSLDN